MFFKVFTEKTILSSECRIYKTERFISRTRRIAGIDFFLSKIAETIIFNYKKLTDEKNSHCFIAKTEGGHSLYFRFGTDSINTELFDKDIIFFNYEDNQEAPRRNDQRLMQYIRSNTSFGIEIINTIAIFKKDEFNKIYNIANADQVNFPLLNEEQKQIVELEDKNVLVQGVAGSGKTNICINKIIFAACRAYQGKILYTTFSRALLFDVKNKVNILKTNIKKFIEDYKHGNVIFVDKHIRKSVENKLGIYLIEETESKIIQKLQSIVKFLDSQVDYYLIEDFYAKYISKDYSKADENFFIKKYASDIKNYQLRAKLEQIKHLSLEVVYKEIYGMICGCCNFDFPDKILEFTKYADSRKDSFSKRTCDIIYSVALDYLKYLQNNKYVDNNIISRKLLKTIDIIPKYSLAIIDEVQDMTEINLYLLKTLTLKVFSVGDALQMINPTYFSFAALKRLLFEKDIVSVAELKNNYRNTKKITEIIEQLGEINVSKFGTHSFVIKGESVDTEVDTSAEYINDRTFIEQFTKNNYDNFTIIVSGHIEKEALRKKLKKQEILTVSEIKGLERDNVIMYNVLTGNYDKWDRLERMLIKRKSADENSVYRYYFNLFYVGVSRAKTHLYVVEEKTIPMFNELFNDYFDVVDSNAAIKSIAAIASVMEEDLDELIERINQFIKLEQYDNARFAANKIADDGERNDYLNVIEVNERFIRYGKHREAGVSYWGKNMLDEAKAQFVLSDDKVLIELIDACAAEDKGRLDIEIVKYLQLVGNNKAATNIILETVKGDLKLLQEQNRDINSKFRSIKERM